jgi:putative ABC transport system permease protein
LLPTVGTSVAEGSFLNAATAQEPVCVLGAAAAQRLGIDQVYSGERIWADNMWCFVAGILNPAVLTPDIDASVLVEPKECVIATAGRSDDRRNGERGHR